MTMQIVTRQMWGAMKPRSHPRFKLPASNIYCANTNTGPCLDRRSWREYFPEVEEEVDENDPNEIDRKVYKRRLRIHVEACEKELRRMQKSHVNRVELHDVMYNFLIGGDGTVYEGRGWLAWPDLPQRFRKLKKQSIFIGYIGEYLVPVSKLPEIMRNSGQALVQHGLRNGWIATDYMMYDIFKGKIVSDD